MIQSGIVPLDQRLGGFVPKRTYVLTGAPGTGKTIACLEFLHAGFEEGQSAVLLTQEDPTDLLAQGQYLGVDLDAMLRDERLVLLRYQLDFARRFARSATPDGAFEELRRLIGSTPPARVVVDSVSPFLEAGAASGAGLQALIQFLESLGATSVVTYPGDLAGLFDRRLEPLVQRAAAVLHFCNDRERGSRIEIRKVRFPVSSTEPIPFSIQPGIGIAGPVEGMRRRMSDVPDEAKRRVIVLDDIGGMDPELLHVLRGQYEVTVHSTLSAAFGDLAGGSGAVLIPVRRDSVRDALTLVRELRRSGNHAPIALLSSFTLRSDDRASALRAGADEFLNMDLHPNELLVRLRALMERGRVGITIEDVEVPLLTQILADGGPRGALSEHDFRNVLTAHLAADRAPFFTLVTMRPSSPNEIDALAKRVLESVRGDRGDVVGRIDGGIAIYLHSARRKDVTPFVERVRERWRQDGRGELDVQTANYPTEEQHFQALLQPQSEPGGSRPTV